MEEEELLRHIKSTLPSEYNETRAILASWMGAQDTIANLKQYLHNYVSVMPNFSARTRQQAEGPNDALITTSTAACRDFQRGTCRRGASCRFAHSQRPQASTAPAARKATQQLCFNFQKGNCTRGESCRFAHIDPKQIARLAQAVNIHQTEDAQAVNVHRTEDSLYYDTPLAMMAIAADYDNSPLLVSDSEDEEKHNQNLDDTAASPQKPLASSKQFQPRKHRRRRKRKTPTAASQHFANANSQQQQASTSPTPTAASQHFANTSQQQQPRATHKQPCPARQRLPPDFPLLPTSPPLAVGRPPASPQTPEPLIT